MSAHLAFRSFAIVALSLVFVNAGVASQYVVWSDGDTATYRDVASGREIQAKIDQGGRTWHHYSNFAGLGPLWVFSYSRDERVYVYSPGDRSFQLLADFNAPIGSSTVLDLDPCNRGSATLAAREAITVPAGSFTGVVRLDFTASCADAGVTSAWFAAGVGPIQWTETTIAGRLTYQMVSATIGGIRYPKYPGVSLLGEFPGPKFWIDMMPVIQGPTPNVNVFLTLRNHTPDDLKYSFSTGQHFEIEVIDTAGRVVSRWSRGRAFTQALNDVTIPPGAERRFGGPVELTYDDGRALAQGHYTLRINLMNSNPPGVSPPQSAAPLEIGWAF
jgi:hypothetical protein